MKNKFLLFFALLCTLGFAGNLNGQTQHWAGPSNQPGFCNGNASMYLAVYVDGVLAQNDNYEIATFMGDDSYTHNGVEYQTYTMNGGQFPFENDLGMYIYCLTVTGYANAENCPTKNYFTIHLWDHENNVEMESSFEWLYKVDQRYGEPNNPIAVHFYTQPTMWELVTDASTLAEGDVLYFTNQATTYALGEEQKNNNRAAYPVSFANGQFTWEEPQPQPDPDDEEEMLPASIYTVQELIYHYAMWNDNYPTLVTSQGYLYAAGGGNYLRTIDFLPETGFETGKMAWDITIEEGLALLTAQADVTQKYMRFNNNNKLFACYNSATNQQPICIYRRVVATEPDYFTLDVTADPATAPVEFTITGTTNDEGNYEGGTEVTVTATSSDATWIFDEWVDGAGETVSAVNPYTFTITDNTTLVAKFHEEANPTFTLEVYVLPDEAAAAGCTYNVMPAAGADGFEADTEITLTAVEPENGSWIFVKWMDALDATLTTELTYTFNITANTKVWAVFEAAPTIVTFDNIAAFKAAYDATSEEIATITGDVTFVYRNGSYIYVQDETAGLLIYDKTTPVITNTYENGDVISGGITGTMKVYKGQKELSPEANPAEGVPGTPVEPMVVTAADVVANYADYDARLVKMEGVTFTEEHTFNSTNTAGRTAIFTQDETTYNVYNQFKTIDLTVTTENNYDVIGFVGIFNDTKQMYPRTNEDIIPVVEPEPETYTVTVLEVENGTLAADVETAEAGATITVTATPAENCTLTSLYYYTEDPEVTTDIDMEAMTFVMPAANVTIGAVFTENETPEPETYTVTVLEVENGTLAADVATAEAGATITVTATPAENCTLTSLYYYTEDPEVTTDIDMEAMTFVMPAANVTIGAVFTENETPEPETYTVTVLEVENGTLAADVATAEAGATITVTATPAENCTLTSLYYYTEDPEVTTDIDMEAMTFVMPAANVTIGAVFTENEIPEPETYTITVLEVENGTLATDVEAAQAGITIGVTATPAENCTLTSLYYYTEDPEVTTDIDMETMTFVMPAANVTIGAVFTENEIPEPETYTITVTIQPAEAGSVTGAGPYTEGATVTLVAQAAEDYVFVKWMEGEAFVASNPTLTFTATADRDLIAVFEEEAIPEPESYTITVLEAENGVISAPETAHEGDAVTVEATPAPLHILTSLYFYTDDPEVTTAINMETMTFEMPAANVTIGAEFSSVASLGDANDDGDVNILDVLTVLNYILGKNPQPFDFEQADMNADGTIDISDAMAINALIHGMKANCGEETALYEVKNGMLVLESPVALAGYQFNLTAEPASVELAGFSTMGNWVNGEYILVVFNLSNEKEAGLYEVLNLQGAEVNSVSLATLTGCKVNAEKGTTSVNSLEANFNVYPVPATTTVTVEGEGINFIEVFNVMGQRVMTANTNEVNVSALSAGTYMFRINTDNGVAIKSVVVVR